MQENEGGRECKKGLARRREGGEGLNEGAGAGAGGLVAGLERARKGGGLRASLPAGLEQPLVSLLLRAKPSKCHFSLLTLPPPSHPLPR